MYCINCGVKLADTEKKCPLCNTVVYHPDLAQADARPLYPVGKRPPTHSGSKALNGAAIILFLIPLVVCLFADMSANHRLDWFGYVAGALAVSYVAVALPLWFRKPNPVIFVPCTFAAVGLYLFLISLAREADEANAVKERMVALNDEIGLLRDRYNAVSLALSALESAAADVKEQFSPALASRAAEIMAQATEGRYDRFILGREMNISYMDNAHGGAVRDADHLSAGTKDMAYISLRIALCEVLCEKGELPMIFDESFASMDEGRLAAILSVIAGRKGQSFILSSGKREGICLNGCNKIKM